MRKLLLTLSACALVCAFTSSALATANFVYHEQTANFVATPTCPSGGTDTLGGRYVENTDRSGAAGFQIYAPETYTARFKVEFQFFTNQVRLYYTTDGSNPSGSFGTPFGTTQVATASYTWVYSDQTQSCQIVDIATGAIPPQPAGTTVKYIIGAWHSGGGPEVFANSGTCTGCFSCTDSTTGCATVFQYNTIAAPATPLIISELRLRGPAGANDEFVEIYNNSNSDVTVNAFDGSAGFALAASDGVARFTIPNGTVIPARGHYLGVNSVSYTLASYPAGNGTTATGDATFTADIPDNVGVALFNTANPANFTLANRLDAAGSVAEASTLYREGAGYPSLITFNIDHSYYRDLTSGKPLDTGDNNNDFLFVDAQGTCALNLTPTCTDHDGTRRGRHLGAPGPETLSSPSLRTVNILS
ncbi:MAG TPA: lamin tail domain-containing protein, partial [Pyrinomonadaceae bacterium]|nr:lamin tail domain-containing protein [Pyrinomonadaceae bacterium]